MNDNTLKGVACPRCGHDEEFRAVAEVTVQITDNGAYADDRSHYNWGDDSWTRCEECGHEGKWKDFRTDAKPEALPRRGRPKLSTDHTDELYIIVDDEGEPISDYYSHFDDCRTVRDTSNPRHRIFRAAYRIIDENPVLEHNGNLCAHCDRNTAWEEREEPAGGKRPDGLGLYPTRTVRLCDTCAEAFDEV